jgi:hypothetical protein
MPGRVAATAPMAMPVNYNIGNLKRKNSDLSLKSGQHPMLKPDAESAPPRVFPK